MKYFYKKENIYFLGKCVQKTDSLGDKQCSICAFLELCKTPKGKRKKIERLHFCVKEKYFKEI